MEAAEYYCATHDVTGAGGSCWVGGETREEMQPMSDAYKERLEGLKQEDPRLIIEDMTRSLGISPGNAYGKQPTLNEILGDNATDDIGNPN